MHQYERTKEKDSNEFRIDGKDAWWKDKQESSKSQ